MARERSIVVRLKAEVASFNQAIQSSARTLSDFERDQAKMGGAASTTMGRLVQSAKINEQEWSTVGRTLTGVGAAITGVGVAALKSGIEYNTLQQTSRAALTTIMKSGEDANRQMDKLDAFARTSPFAKQVFIEAQQQMLGFGIESRKVIPYMDAIQNAVAATGGSNQDIAELANVFSKVQANAKITARELMEFGIRGVDAATIIGSQMGKTGAEIRDEITAGTLDAGEALDALAAGMQEQFGGAAANVKETIAGAFDRVKAAWRDLSAELASPFVSPDGGGLLIDWLNSLADTMRRFEAAPGWVKGTIGVLGGLAGVLSLGAGAFMLALPKYIAFREALSTLAAVHPSMGKLADGLSKLGGGIKTLGIAAGGAVATIGVVAATLNALQGFGGFEQSVERAANNLVKLNEAGSVHDALFGDMAGKVRMNTEMFGDFGSAVEAVANPNLIDRLLILTGQAWLDPAGIVAHTEAFGDLGVALAQLAVDDMPAAQEAFARMWEEAGGTEEAFQNLLAAMPAFEAHLLSLATEMGLAGDDATLLAIATGELEVATDAAADATEDATGAIFDHIDALRLQYEASMAMAGMALDASSAEIAYRDSVVKATAAIGENEAGLDLMTEAGRRNREEINNVVDRGLRWVEVMREQGATTEELQAFVQELRGEVERLGGDAGLTADEVAGLGDELGLIPGDYHAQVVVDTSVAMSRVNALQTALNGVKSTAGSIGNVPGLGHVNAGQLYHGGIVKGLNAGGMVPGPRAGYDNITWPLYTGGRILGQPLEGGEYVVRSSMVPKYLPQLEAMNAGRYSGGPVAASPSSSGGMSGFPSHVTLVDESGALLGRMRVVAQQEDDRLMRSLVRR